MPPTLLWSLSRLPRRAAAWCVLIAVAGIGLATPAPTSAAIDCSTMLRGFLSRDPYLDSIFVTMVTLNTAP